jgi:hypothetical protein
MMNRLLVLMLALGMATVANAVLIEVDGYIGEAIFPPDPVVTVIVVGEDTSSWLGYLIVDAGGSGWLSNAEVLPGAGDLASAVAYIDEPDWGLGYELTAAASPTGSIAAGPRFTVDYSRGEGRQWTTISLYLDPEYEVPAAQVWIPEPMTVMLLGLGGLFLRRRK